MRGGSGGEPSALGPVVPPPQVVRAVMGVRGVMARVRDRLVPGAAVHLERLAGLMEVRLLGVVCELEVPDALAGAPLDAESLAGRVGADADAVERVMRFLVSRGVFRRTRDGRFTNNGASDLLRAAHPASMRDWLVFVGSSWHAEIWSRADHSVRTGRSGTEAAFGRSFFDYVQLRNPVAGSQFDAAMATGARLQGELLLRALDVGGASSMCDVGGGTGALLGAFLRRYPGMRGELYDLPSVVARIDDELDGVGDRCTVTGGDFFASVPVGHDVYVLTAIVHDWGDDDAARILGNVRAALRPGARAIVVDSVLPDHDGPDFSKQFDVLMLVLTGSGRERTAVQFDALFARAGLRVARDNTLPNLFHAFELVAA